MFGSIKIGSIFGIHVRVHWLFVALVVFLLLWSHRSGQNALWTLLAILALALVVLLHELGHSLVARRFGIRVLDITFWPLGGMARMSEIPENSRVEGLIAIAGPAVNFALAALVAPLCYWSFQGAQASEPWALSRPAFSAASYFLAINLLLGAFNLIPAFPMDGGRVLRAVLARRGDWLRATEQAVRVGRVFAVAMVAFGLWFTGDGFFLLPLIGLFVWYAGSRELWAVRMRHAPSPFSIFFRPDPAASSDLGGISAAELARPSGNGHSAPPQASDGARRPSGDWRAPVVERGRALSDADIERLERFRGRLGRGGADQ